MIIFDVESDGLIEDATKIHCLSYTDGGEIKTIYEYDEMRKLLLNSKALLGHNIIRYDIPLLNKLLDIKITKMQKIHIIFTQNIMKQQLQVKQKTGLMSL